MFNFVKRATSAIVAGAVVLGTLAFYPYGDKGKVNAATLYDSASAINYASILGGAVDYGIVAETIVQNNHTETTFATNTFIHNKDNIDVDYINSTALFLIGKELKSDNDNITWDWSTWGPINPQKHIEFGYTTASAIYLEAPESVYGPSNIGQPTVHFVDFNPAEPTYQNLRNGNIWFGSGFTTDRDKIPFIQAVNKNAYSNVDRLKNRICSPDAVEDAEKGWAYFLNDRANSPLYQLDTNDSKYRRNEGTSKLVINTAYPEFDGKVVYINVTSDMLPYLQEASSFIIEKNPSSVVVININDDITSSGFLLSKPVVRVNGIDYDGHTASNGGGNDADRAYAKAIQENYNQTVIWNIMESEEVQLQNAGGAVLAPNASGVRLVKGNSCGWIVTTGTFYMDQEFHFLYSGSSKDSYGQMHFALTKAFTEKYASHGSKELKQDTSASVTADTYLFTCDEYLDETKTRGEFKDYYRSLDPVYAQTDGTVTFPILTFYCDNYDSLSDAQKHYYVGRGTDKLFFFKVKEVYAAPHVISGNDGRFVAHSDGYIDIRLKVSVDSAGRFTYFVDYESVTGKDASGNASGNNIVFRKYGEVYGDFIKMSGVQFDFGAFYNQLVPITVNISKRDINKSSGDEVKGAVLTVDYVGNDSNVDLSNVSLVCDGKDVTSNAKISKSSVEFTSGDKMTSIVGLKPGDYTLKETTAPEGYKPQTTVIYFTVGADGTVTATQPIADKVGKIENKDTVVILDEPLPTVNISKRDVNVPNGAEVPGATLKVTYVGSDTTVDLSNVILTRGGAKITGTATKTTVEFQSGTEQTVITGLQPGNYTLEETIAPDNYEKQTTVINFTVGKDGKVSATSTIPLTVGKIENSDTVVILDEKKPEPITVNFSKQDVNTTSGDEVAGATLKVTYIGNDTSVDLSKVTLSRNGTDVTNAATRTTTSVAFTSAGEQTAITGLQPGNYKFEETIAPDNFELQTTVIYFTVGTDGKVSATSTIPTTVGRIENSDTVVILDEKTPAPITVNISKQDINQTNGAEVAGATLEVKYIGNDSTVDLSNVTLERSGNDVTNNAAITKDTVTFRSGAAQTAITGLKPGDYTLTETIAPDNYEIQKTVIYFTVGADGKVSATSTIPSTVGKILNDDTVVILDEKTPAPITVNISKQDINQTNGAEVEGATLKVTYVGSDTSVDLSKVTLSRNGTDVTSAATKTTTTVTFTSAGAQTAITGLKPGDYTLTETIAPDGYKLQQTVIYFTVGADGTVSATQTISDKVGRIENKDTVVILDEPLPSVNISKRDVNVPNGAEVPGATLKVTYVGSETTVDLSNVILTRGGTKITGTATKTTVEFKSGTEQTVITGLQPGNYTLEETIAPDNYEKQTTVIYFTVGNDGKVSATSTIPLTVGKIENSDTVVILDEKSATPTGSLVISKTISDAPLADFERLSFEVVDENGKKISQDIPDLTTANVNNGTWKSDGTGTYTYTVNDLEADKTFTVTETYDGLGSGSSASTKYELNSSSVTEATSGKIVAGGEVKVELTDDYDVKTTPVTTGSLVISKTISDAPLADFERLSFEVLDENGKKISQDIPDLTTANVENGTWKSDGTGTYTYTVNDLEADKTFTVTETYDGLGSGSSASTKYELNSSSVTEATSGKIVAGGEVKVELTDAYKTKTTTPTITDTPAPAKTGSLVISKTISGTPLNELETISFVVENADDSSETYAVPDLTTANVNNSTWQSDGNGTYTYTIYDLTAGEKYVVMETYNGTEGSTEYILSSSSTTDGTGTIKEGGEVIVELTDKYEANTTPAPVPPQPEYGTLEITKTILGVDAADLDGSAIVFVIEGPSDFNGGNSKTVTYDVFVNGRWTMEDVPAGEYKVTETGNGASAVYPLISTEVNGNNAASATVTLAKDEMASFAFINTYDDTASISTGTIEITKTLSGAYAKDINADAITFTVKGPDTYNSGNIKTIPYSAFVDGRWSEEDVPVGEYTVTETASGETQTFELVLTTVNGAAKTSDTETLAADDIVSFAFVNTYKDTTTPGPSPATTGSLTITKVLAGDYPYYAADKTFFFVVEGPSYPNGTTVNIKGAGSETLDDLIPGDYTVAEVEDKAVIDGYTVTVSGNGAAVTVTAGDDADCTFTNTYAEIKSTPTDTPTPTPTSAPTDTPTPIPTPTDAPAPGPDSGLELTFEKTDEVGTLIANAVLTLTSKDGYDLSGVEVTQNGVSVEIMISDDLASISFTTVDTSPSIVSGLLPGSYELKETVTPEGYLTADSIHFVLNADGSYTKDLDVIVAGSPVVMIDRADPNYRYKPNPDKINNKDIDNHKDKQPDNNPDNNKPNSNPKTNSGNGSPIPATGEQKSYLAAAGVMLIGLCASILAGLGVYRKKKSDN